MGSAISDVPLYLPAATFGTHTVTLRTQETTAAAFRAWRARNMHFTLRPEIFKVFVCENLGRNIRRNAIGLHPVSEFIAEIFWIFEVEVG